MDPLHQGVDTFLGATHGEVCLVQVLIRYFAVHCTSPGLVFIFQWGYHTYKQLYGNRGLNLRPTQVTAFVAMYEIILSCTSLVCFCTYWFLYLPDRTR